MQCMNKYLVVILNIYSLVETFAFGIQTKFSHRYASERLLKIGQLINKDHVSCFTRHSVDVPRPAGPIKGRTFIVLMNVSQVNRSLVCCVQYSLTQAYRQAEMCPTVQHYVMRQSDVTNFTTKGKRIVCALSCGLILVQ